MPDLVIIHPNGSHGVYGSLDAALVAVEPPLWARLIAGYVRDRGHSVAIIDAEALQLGADVVARQVIELGPLLVCLVVYGHQPSASTQQMVGAREIVDAILRRSIRTKDDLPYTIIVGGHVSALPIRTLKEESIDFACVGEGPVTVEMLLASIKSSGITSYVLAGIPGLVWERRINPTAPLLDLRHLHGNAWDLLPMDCYRAHNWQCLDNSARRSYASIYTSLGCPYKCLAGNTLVNTIYGPIEISRLAREFKTVPVFAYDPKTGDAKICTANNIRQYGEERLVRVHFDDGTSMDVTPDHQFMQFKWGNGRGDSESQEWSCEAKGLKAGAHVRAIRMEVSAYGYPIASWKRRASKAVHRMVAEWMSGRPLRKGEIVHHLDHDKSNWLPENLEICTSAKEHFLHHPEISTRMRQNNPTKDGVGRQWRENISKALIGLKRSDEAKENYRRAAVLRSSDPKYIEKLRVAARKREVGYRWFTTPEGKSYRALNARSVADIPGRKGFNAHRPINHIVVRVEWLNGLRPVYCLTVPETGWFYANNVAVRNCSFCCINAPFQSNRYRMREPADVVEEMIFLYERYGVTTFKIVDEMFILNERHYTAICRRIIETDRLPLWRLNIWAYARIDTVKPDTLELLRRAGFRWLALGIESGSKHVRDGAEKALRHDDIKATVRAIQAAGINVIGNYIFGLPDDDIDTMHETLDMALDLNTEFANFYSAMAYPGSRLYDEAVEKGWTLPETWAGYSQHNRQSRPLDTQHVSGEIVLRFRDAAFNRYFTNPAYLQMIQNRFGNAAVGEIRKMTAYRLERDLLQVA